MLHVAGFKSASEAQRYGAVKLESAERQLRPGPGRGVGVSQSGESGDEPGKGCNLGLLQ